MYGLGDYSGLNFSDILRVINTDGVGFERSPIEAKTGESSSPQTTNQP